MCNLQVLEIDSTGGRLSVVGLWAAHKHTCHHRWMFGWWCACGDRFHFTRPPPSTLSFPLPIKARAQTARLASANKAESIRYKAMFAILHFILISEYVYTSTRTLSHLLNSRRWKRLKSGIFIFLKRTEKKHLQVSDNLSVSSCLDSMNDGHFCLAMANLIQYKLKYPLHQSKAYYALAIDIISANNWDQTIMFHLAMSFILPVHFFFKRLEYVLVNKPILSQGNSNNLPTTFLKRCQRNAQ